MNNRTAVYFGAVQDSAANVYRIVVVTKRKGEPSQQADTRETCKTRKATVAKVENMNRALFAVTRTA